MSKSNKISASKFATNRSDKKQNDKKSCRKGKPAARSTGNNTEKNTAEYASHAYNDMSWYTRNPVLLESACRVPFAYPTGKHIPMGMVYSNEAGEAVKTTPEVATAGVMAITYVPSVGNTDDGLSAPINIAAREMYSRVRKAYSGTLVCDAPDLMLYMLSLDGIFSYIAYLKRLYRLLDVYSGSNKYVVRGLMEAMGFSADALDDLRRNKMNLWGMINTFISDANKWSCPAQFDILNRHYWMNDNIYIDRVSSKAQMYIFVPQGFYHFGLDDDSKGQVTVEFPDAYTYEGLVKFGKLLLNTLSNSEDAYTINGYLARAFEGTPNFRVAELGINDKQEFVYSEEVLNQIHNLNVAAVLNDACTVTQNGVTGALSAQYTGTMSYATDHNLIVGSNLRALDSVMEVPDAVNVVVGSRLHSVVIASPDVPNKTVKYRVNGGTEIVVSLVIYRFSNKDEKPMDMAATNQSYVLANLDKNYARLVSWISQFDWAPILMSGWWDQVSKMAVNWNILGDVTNLTSVDDDAMENLHRMCIYSEFNAFGIDT